MIVSASRRTDIPAYYFPWFLERLKKGEVLVRNPMNLHQVSRVLLNKESVDGIVFWSKYPAPMLKGLSELDPYPYYIQYTLNGYGKEMEGGLPDIWQRIGVFHALAERLGPERMIWRYDPILFSRDYTPVWHREKFKILADALAGSAGRCVISFMDMYRRIQKKMKELDARVPVQEEMLWIGEEFGRIAVDNGMEIQTCAEEIELEQFGIQKGACIDQELLSRLAGRPLRLKKDKNQREACGCAASVDIGCYDTCRSQCAYCYAVCGKRTRTERLLLYDKDSPFLCGRKAPEDVVKTRLL